MSKNADTGLMDLIESVMRQVAGEEEDVGSSQVRPQTNPKQLFYAFAIKSNNLIQMIFFVGCPGLP